MNCVFRCGVIWPEVQQVCFLKEKKAFSPSFFLSKCYSDVEWKYNNNKNIIYCAHRIGAWGAYKGLQMCAFHHTHAHMHAHMHTCTYMRTHTQIQTQMYKMKENKKPNNMRYWLDCSVLAEMNRVTDLSVFVCVCLLQLYKLLTLSGN